MLYIYIYMLKESCRAEIFVVFVLTCCSVCCLLLCLCVSCMFQVVMC